MMNVLYPPLLKSVILSICSRDPTKTQPWDIFARLYKAKFIGGCYHDGSLEDNPATFFRLKFLIPTLCRKPSNTYEGSDFVSSISGNKLGKCTFL